MSKSSQRKKQMYALGYRVGLGEVRADTWRRSSIQGWQAYKEGQRAGHIERCRRRAPKTPWGKFKAWLKMLFK